MEDLSSQKPQIIQQVIQSGVLQPPPVPTKQVDIPANRKKAYNQGLVQLKILLEVKERILELGMVEPNKQKQFKKEISDIKEKLKEFKTQ
jgi:hypothetical protein